MQANRAIDTVEAVQGLSPARGGPTDPSHDELLRRGIIDTAVSRPVAALLSLAFLAFVYGIPLSQALREKAEDEDSSVMTLFQRAPTRDNLREFEHELEQASYAKSFVQPRLQALLTRFGKVGNKRAVVGRQGFLFYTPGLLHLAGPSFIDADAIARRQRDTESDAAAGATPIHADPRPAIFDFNDQLAKRGIKLVLFPVPDKTMLQPRQLHGRAGARAPRMSPIARNVGWNAFARELRAHGVALFDPTPSGLLSSDAPRFLAQDTHWTPGFMQQVAEHLARFVQTLAALPLAHTEQLHTQLAKAERVGDLVDMLKLPEDQRVFQPQSVVVQRVEGEAGAAWEPNSESDVLLLGDSFTNVYSLDAMGWGDSAGLAPQLARALGQGVDVIAQNDSGAFATRQTLARELGAGNDRLAGKRVVIWEFAIRELSVGDWKPIELPRAVTARAE